VRRFSSILFSPLGKSDNAAAVDRVAELVAGNNARLTLYGVVPEPSGLSRVLHPATFLDEVQQADRNAMKKRLSRWAARNPVPDVKTTVEAGNQALSIINRVITNGHDLVVVTTDEDREDQATIRRLVRKCPCPVWIIRRTRARTQRVLAAVNPNPGETELNRTVLELAASIVEQFGGELHLVHAWQLYGEATMRSSGFIRTTPAEIEQMLKREEVSHARALDELITHCSLQESPWQIHLDKGPPEEVVRRVAEKSRINLLIMGTLARTGIPGVLIGNTAERILDEVKCSVIAVKPPGFVSPITSHTS
jgi:universal stress protein E